MFNVESKTIDAEPKLASEKFSKFVDLKEKIV